VQSQEHAHFFYNKGIVDKEFILVGKTALPHTLLTFYGDCVKMYKYFIPNLGDKRTGCCITTTHRFTLPFH
jgi:hypothetical protein